MAALTAFSKVLQSLRISPNSTVGLAVSGDSNSIALALLARQYFENRIVGITVDHQLHPHSNQEALKVKGLVKSLGLEHVLVTMELPEGIPSNTAKIQALSHNARYNMLLEQCREKELKTLLCGHHADNQVETFLLRLSLSSGFLGLACMLSHGFYYPHTVPVVRPLLSVRKEILMQLCSDNNLEWVEDPTNALPINRLNRIRLELQKQPVDIHEGIMDIIGTLGGVRKKMNQELLSALKMVKVNNSDGYVTINYTSYLKLSLPAARKLLAILCKFLCPHGKHRLPSSQNFWRIHNSIMKRVKDINTCSSTFGYGTCSHCIVFHYSNTEFGMARVFFSNMSSFEKIEVGQTVHWDKRFMIALHHLDSTDESKRNHTFYIRNMTKNDYNLTTLGIRKTRAAKLPHEMSRGSLPVIVAEKEGVKKESWPVVLIPHFRVIDRQYGVKCTWAYKPYRKLGSFFDHNF